MNEARIVKFFKWAFKHRVHNWYMIGVNFMWRCYVCNETTFKDPRSL